MDESTLKPEQRTELLAARSRSAITIAFHPDASRVGEWLWLDELAVDGVVQINRRTPSFRGADGVRRPLADRHISRRSLTLRLGRDGGVEITVPPSAMPARLNGALITDTVRVEPERLFAGAVLEISNRVVLLIHERDDVEPVDRMCGIIGESPGVHQLRREILQVAELPIPVLLRGESGTGKELAARAIHAASRRASKPCVCVNMAALNGQTAVAELFGYARGAFTGAVRAHDGYFREADGGTLFLDEIGESPPEVQVMLLRVLETGEIQPLGGGASRPVDVRLLAATDTDLERAVAHGRFRLSLLHRLASYEIWLPPLRRRRDDIARLFVYFLRKELRRYDEQDKLDASPRARPWLPASVVAQLVRYDWPGNVRQLMNLARQIVVSSHGGASLRPSSAVVRLLEHASEKTRPQAQEAGATASKARSSAAPELRRRPPSEISERELVEALRANSWRISATARHFGISKTSLYTLIEQCPRIRKARDLTPEEIVGAKARCAGSIERMSAALEVSVRGLQLRMRELGIS